MRRVNIASPEYDFDSGDPEGFRAGMFRMGKELGAEHTGASVYVLPPGQAICPYHYECGEEEWVVVLDGRPTLRHPDGTDVLDTWDVVAFVRGPDGAHRIQNDTDEPVRLLMFSEVVVPTATVYPDSDKVGVWTGNKADDVLVKKSSAVDYYDGET